MADFAYHVVDVFTTTPFEGNALAVFPDGTGLHEATMQRIARAKPLGDDVYSAGRVVGRCDARANFYAGAGAGVPGAPADWHGVRVFR